MRGTRAKWIRKVVFSKHPKVLEMIIECVGEEQAKTVTYTKVIKLCKKMWKTQMPGVEQWEIYTEKGDA